MRRCQRCGQKAVVYLPQHRLSLCKEHYIEWYLKRVESTIREFKMFGKGDRVLVAVSGGKDSLSLWDALQRLGYRVEGLYIDLGIGEYSQRSRLACERFARERGLELYVLELRKEIATIPEIKEVESRPACSFCGQLKRYYMNRFAREKGYHVIATGHNLDDESATLLSNVLSWNMGYLSRQFPVLLEGDGFVRKVKPLVKFTEKENALYAFLSDIEYVEEECPFSEGASSIEYKRILSQIEEKSPGTKLRFYMDFLRRLHSLLRSEEVNLRPCRVCGEPTSAEVCSVCRLRERLSSRLLSSSPSS
ncbi:TIGR00269 family protein [Pampinifervens florentissimum]|uniref:TIGR00269 family protein n=1 Tax=Pampinifervens florentissimum TaxID=1632019 RepID=UPI0013B48B85|nr:TIGR00269 family protein [Hydrogenobacter sp. T-8]QID32761.1 TIGR00269 family protein [Hydrogenobacter sp. T-8]